MSQLELAKIDLVIANRVLANVGAVDAYGHVSVRHPTRADAFLISHSRSPSLVDLTDIMVVGLDGDVLEGDRPPYMERFIHAAVYAARPNISAVAHGHARVLIPFTVVPTLRMRPIFFTSDEIGETVPVWDIRSTFGSATDMLITNLEQGADLASALGSSARVVLMRGHGFVSAGRSSSQLIRVCKALLDNAHIQLESIRYGEPIVLTAEEIEQRRRTLWDDESPGLLRGLEFDAAQAGVAHLFEARRTIVVGLRPSQSLTDV